MLTNLNFIEVGQQWPPICEKHRMEMYSKNRELFEGEHAEVYTEDLKRIERVIGNFQQVISYPVVLNFQKLMSLKIADLLLGEPPQITVGDKESIEQTAIDTIEKTSDLINTSYQVAIDVSRFGDGLFYIRNNADGGLIDITQPSIWYPVISCDNVRDIQYHVLAWTYEVEERGTEHHYLKAQIHSKGSYEERILELVGSEIQKLISSEVIQTGLLDFAVIQVSNVITSDRATGLDDYTDIDSIIGELLVRIGQVSRILDKHASPSMSGPQTALERDPATGEWRLKTGNYFPRESRDDPDVTYITWDGQLAANFTQIEKLINLLYTISEMGSALFGDMTGTTGQAPSGTALKRLMISPLAKVNRIRMRFDGALKKALILCSQLGGKNITNLTDVDISILWQDGLPGDPKEDAEIINLRTAGKPTMSQIRVLTQFDAMSADDADEELAKIQDEEAASTPMPAAPFSNSPDASILTEGQVQVPTAAKESLNGAQMQSLLSIISSVSAGTLSRTAAINLITSSLPMSQVQAESIIEDNTGGV